MRDRAGRGSWSGMIGAGLLVLGVVLPTLCYRQVGPFLDPGEIERQNAEHHRCDLADCMVCEHNRQWLLENPGRRVGDLVQLAEIPGSFVVEPVEPDPLIPPSPTALADSSPVPVEELIEGDREPIRVTFDVRWELLPTPNRVLSPGFWPFYPKIVTEPAPIYDGT